MENNETRDSLFASQSVSHTTRLSGLHSNFQVGKHAVFISLLINSLHQLWHFPDTNCEAHLQSVPRVLFFTCAAVLSGPKNKETKSIRPAVPRCFLTQLQT